MKLPSAPSARRMTTRPRPAARRFQDWPLKPKRRWKFGQGDYAEPVWVKESWQRLRRDS